MTVTVNVGEAKTRLSELLARVEAGEEVVIARDSSPVARLSRIRPKADISALIEEMLVERQGRTPATAEELIAWRDEGRRF